METFLRFIRHLIPQPVFAFFQPAYHLSLAFVAALRYGFPSRRLTVIGVTGTKGKSSVTEITNAIFEEAGYTTAVLGTVRFKIAQREEQNLFKMTMPGRFFVQAFLARAVKAGCTHAIIEMTSEGAKQFRQRFIAMDALIFTNLAPEHIESHGSFEKYAQAKVQIAKTLTRSSKKNRFLVVNIDDKEAPRFTQLPHAQILPYSLQDAGQFEATTTGTRFTFEGTAIESPLRGVFNIMNMLAGATTARAFGVPLLSIQTALKNLSSIPGRVESIRMGQDFDVVVDYAHTPDSLTALYSTFTSQRKICVLGNTGGGRDTWKRPEMGKIAEAHCDTIILTNEDPYDEDPETIVSAMASGMKTKKPRIIMDRREAIKVALKEAKAGDVVLITGKGTDPYIMGKNGSKLPWSDKNVVRELLQEMTQ